MERILKEVSDALIEAKVYGLEVEVIATALDYIKHNPTESIDDALQYGLNEWIK